MNLTVDIGNTNIVFGIFKNNELINRFEIPSNKNFGVKQYWSLVKNGIPSKKKIYRVIICSVVPALRPVIEKICVEKIKVKPKIFDSTTDVGILNKYKNPEDVGSDRIVNAFAAWKLYGLPAIIVDLGTAITIDAITKNAEYLGGVISPGIGISLDALHSRTALLPKVELKAPRKILGTDTKTSIQSGITYGYIGLITTLVSGLKKELGFGVNTNIVITGGYTKILRKELEKITENIDPDLTLKGLNLILFHLQKKRK